MVFLQTLNYGCYDCCNYGSSKRCKNLIDIGTDADTDGFVDGITAAVNSTGFKGRKFPCNGVLGMSGGTTTAATATADEVEIIFW